MLDTTSRSIRPKQVKPPGHGSERFDGDLGGITMCSEQLSSGAVQGVHSKVWGVGVRDDQYQHHLPET